MSFDQLKELFQANLMLKGTASETDRLLDRWICGKLTETDLREALFSFELDKATDTLDNWMEEAKRLLLINLLNEMQIESEDLMLLARTQVRKLALNGWFEELQLAQAYLALNCELTRQPYNGPSPQQLPNGSALLDTGNRSAHQQAPLAPQHAELGALWALIGSASGDQTWLTAAYELATWQSNLLDEGGMPINGMLTSEPTGSLGGLLVAYAALYRTVSRLGGRAEFESLAVRQIAGLRELVDQRYVDVDPLCVLLEEWAIRYRPNLQAKSYPLSPVVCDPTTPLVGIRDEQVSAFATLTGGRSGLGSIQAGDLSIVTYGPQSDKFGISGEPTDDSTAHADEKGFSMTGRVRLDEAWLDVHQEWRESRLAIDTAVYSVGPMEDLAFSFFVFAPSVVVDGIHTLEPFSLDRYQGAVESVELRSEHSRIQLLAMCGRGELNVIPLSGGHSFWGANFLISYTLDPTVSRYGWRLKFSLAATESGVVG